MALPLEHARSFTTYTLSRGVHESLFRPVPTGPMDLGQVG